VADRVYRVDLNRSGRFHRHRHPHASLSSLGVGVRALRSGHHFSSSRRGRTSTGELKPFLSGAAYLAIRAQCRWCQLR